jgi:hypothetical protein
VVFAIVRAYLYVGKELKPIAVHVKENVKQLLVRRKHLRNN